MSAQLRADLAEIPGYVPGRKHPGAVSLASNEVGFGPLPSVAEAITKELGGVNRYPDNQSTDLRAALSQTYGIPVANITIGCGSVGLCQELVQLTCGDSRDEVLFGWRSFEAYPILTRIGHATAVPIGLTAGQVIDMDALAAAITDRTRLIFVCNPNNPTGTAVGRAALERFLAAVPPRVVVALDEAYIEYLRWTESDRPDGVELVRRWPNLVVLRTFSKAYGLAGLRCGYAIGDPEIITALNKVHLPFSVSRVAQTAAIASLEARSELLERTDHLIEQREQMRSILLAAGYRIPPSQANFLWLQLGAGSVEFAEASAAHGVLVRPFSGEGVRVTIGSPAENSLLREFATDPKTQRQFTRR